LYFPELRDVAVGVAMSAVLTGCFVAFRKLLSGRPRSAVRPAPPPPDVSATQTALTTEHGQLILKVQRANLKELSNLRGYLKILHGEVVALKVATQQMRTALDDYHRSAQGGADAPASGSQLPLDLALNAIKQGCDADECARRSGVDLETIEILMEIHAPAARPRG